MSDSRCVLCQGPGLIQIETVVMFSICESPECHKRLPQYLYDNEWLDGELTIFVRNRKLRFKNDKRVIKGLPNRLREVLHGRDGTPREAEES